VPPDRWLAVDSAELATPAGHVPAFRLLQVLGFKSDALVLTHPHLDHARGFAELVNEHGAGPIGASRCWSELRPTGPEPDDAQEVLALGAAEAAIAAIQDRWYREPATQWHLVQGSTIEVGDARVSVLYPDPAAIERFVTRGGGNPNTISSPLLVEWNETRLLLGADLPRAQWAALERLGLQPPLADHDGLKLPHHGSKRSLHPVFAAAPTMERHRPWIVAPWTRAQGPPTFVEGGDVAALLTWTTELHFTCISRALRMDLRAGDRITRGELSDSIERIRFGDEFVLEIERLPEDESGSWVAVAIAPDGAAELHYGNDAVVVVTDTS
jgi:hypothetical protein